MYWKFRHIVEALKYVELAPEAATADAITLTDGDADPTTESSTQFEPPCFRARVLNGEPIDIYVLGDDAL
ncbi:hypothetical protein CNMCM5793_005860 [Aspergillus hiratsukae]|uniref:Uncharacterized protein n=1 Tax=Aspergillus hiratsukae TaxID=1194566 RepID=A0A8H6UZ08_9EURO|nr:hypothetical protein CNMCM5793_005860 [Aspergillus hiratsukae]KAF7172468.1 hypothetical protein CNMCM6106_006664 [Aspergillus hiratsukae]